MTTETSTVREVHATLIIPQEWLDLFALLPGYDPVATAGPDCVFDVRAAERACAFFPEMLCYIEGEDAGQPFVLQRWQKAIVGCLFGWKRRDASGRMVRRYRKLFLYVPRKNGKTPFVAGLLLLISLCDGEPGAQIYAAASSAKQAGILFKHMTVMGQRNGDISARMRIYKSLKSIEFPQVTTCQVLSANADAQHGKNTHCFAIDELHAQKDRELVDALATSTGTRRQPLEIYLTTADYDRPSICNELYDYACKVRDRVFEDERFLPVLFEALPTDDWKDPAVWAKANPNLGVSIKLDWIREEAARAARQPSYLNTFKRLHLNIRTGASVAWLMLHEWDQCATELPDLTGRPCYAGLDLSSNRDPSAFTMVFPPEREGEPIWVKSIVWIPEAGAKHHEDTDRVPYFTWADQGHVRLSPGDAVDYAQIEREIMELTEVYHVQTVAVDRWNAQQLCQNLQSHGINVGFWGQGFRDMSGPAKEWERLVIIKGLAHGGNPVLRWMAGNCMVETDPAGNIKPSKKKSTNRIDAIVAAIMALGVMMMGGHSVCRFYETNDLEMA